MPISEVFTVSVRVFVQLDPEESSCPDAHGERIKQAMQAREPVASPLNSVVIQNQFFLQGL
jgi:hypothetical protein